MVFSKVGGAGLSVIALMSARYMASVPSNAAGESDGLTLSQAGTPPYGPVHSAAAGLDASEAGRGVTAGAPAWAAAGLVVVILVSAEAAVKAASAAKLAQASRR